jgi:hypothetical protein
MLSAFLDSEKQSGQSLLPTLALAYVYSVLAHIMEAKCGHARLQDMPLTAAKGVS